MQYIFECKLFYELPY